MRALLPAVVVGTLVQVASVSADVVVNRDLVACNRYAHVKCIKLSRGTIVGFVRTTGVTTTIFPLGPNGEEGEHYTVDAYAIDASNLRPVLIQRPRNLHVRIVNGSSEGIIGLFASPTTNRNWHPNMIPHGEILAPSRSIYANFDDGSGNCVYDLKAVDIIGKTVVKEAVNVCEMTRWTLHD